MRVSKRSHTTSGELGTLRSHNNHFCHGTLSSGPKPFLFYNNWLLDKEFDRLIQEWRNCAVQGWSGYVPQRKFKDLKVKINGWRGHSRTHTEEKIKLLEGELQWVTERLESDGMFEEL